MPLRDALGFEDEIPRMPLPPSDFGILPTTQHHAAAAQDGGVFMQPRSVPPLGTFQEEQPMQNHLNGGVFMQPSTASFGMAPVQRQQDPPPLPPPQQSSIDATLGVYLSPQSAPALEQAGIERPPGLSEDLTVTDNRMREVTRQIGADFAAAQQQMDAVQKHRALLSMPQPSTWFGWQPQQQPQQAAEQQPPQQQPSVARQLMSNLRRSQSFTSEVTWCVRRPQQPTLRLGMQPALWPQQPTSWQPQPTLWPMQPSPWQLQQQEHVAAAALDTKVERELRRYSEAKLPAFDLRSTLLSRWRSQVNEAMWLWPHGTLCTMPPGSATRNTQLYLNNNSLFGSRSCSR